MSTAPAAAATPKPTTAVDGDDAVVDDAAVGDGTDVIKPLGGWPY